MFELHEYNSGVCFNIKLVDKVCIFNSGSGTGKTFMCNTIEGYCFSNNISCQNIGYNSYGKTSEEIVDSCKGCSVVLLDKSDTYLRSEMLKEIAKSADLVIVCMHHIHELDISQSEAGIYLTEFEDNNIITRKVW